MATARFMKAIAAVALFNGVLYLSLPSEAQAGPAADAARFTMELKTAKDAKTKANALHELGKLAAIMKSYAEEALPLIYKSLEDPDASVRAAAAQALGACDEPADKAVPPLIKGYLRCGAWVCGNPAWDPDFNTADLLMLLPMSRLDGRYARHFMKHDH